MAGAAKGVPFKVGPWLDLFDGAYVESALDYLRGAIGELEAGGVADPAASIRSNLLEPVAAYFHQHWEAGRKGASIVAAKRLIECGTRLSAALDGPTNFDPVQARACLADLEGAWLWFIVHAAGPYLYHVLPRQQKQRQEAPRGKRAYGWPQYISADDVVAVERACGGAAAKASVIISALEERAESNVPKGVAKPGGDLYEAAKRAYVEAVGRGLIPRRARGRPRDKV